LKILPTPQPCLEHSCSYLNSVPDTAAYKERWLEAWNKYSDLQKRKIVYEDSFQAYVQHCTDGDPSASQIEGKASKASSTSSIKRKRELIVLRKAKRELEANLQLQLAELDAKEENLMLDDEHSEISGRKDESHHSNISLKKYAKQLPSASKTQLCVSQTTSISANFTNVKDVGSMMYSKPVTQPTPSMKVPKLSSLSVIQPTTSPLNYTSSALPETPTPYVMTNPAPSHRVTFAEERWTNYDSSQSVYANPAAIPFQRSMIGPKTTREKAPSNANIMTAESLKCLGSIIQQGFSLPKRSVPTFDGNPFEYFAFTKSFQETILIK